METLVTNEEVCDFLHSAKLNKTIDDMFSKEAKELIIQHFGIAENQAHIFLKRFKEKWTAVHRSIKKMKDRDRNRNIHWLLSTVCEYTGARATLADGPKKLAPKAREHALSQLDRLFDISKCKCSLNLQSCEEARCKLGSSCTEVVCQEKHILCTCYPEVPKEDREYLRDQRAKVVATGGRFQLGPVDAEHVLAEEKRKQSAEYAAANAESVLKRMKKCYVKIKVLPDIVFSEGSSFDDQLEEDNPEPRNFRTLSNFGLECVRNEEKEKAVKGLSHHQNTDQGEISPVTRSINNTTPAVELLEIHDEEDVKVKDDIDTLVSDDPLSTEFQEDGSDFTDNIGILNPVNIKEEINNCPEDPLTFEQLIKQEADPLELDPMAIRDPLAIDNLEHFPVLQKSLRPEDQNTFELAQPPFKLKISNVFSLNDYSSGDALASVPVPQPLPLPLPAPRQIISNRRKELNAINRNISKTMRDELIKKMLQKRRTSPPWSFRQQRHLSFISEFTSSIVHLPGAEI